MNTNEGEKTPAQQPQMIFPELSYTLTGLLFAVHNEIGRFAREKQYGDIIERELERQHIPYVREYRVADTGNITDFIVADKIILEIKAKRLLSREDFYQLQRYLQATQKKLGLLVNFQDRYLKPKRIVRIDTDKRKRFLH